MCRPGSSGPLTTLNAGLSSAWGAAKYRRPEQRPSKATRKEAIKVSMGPIVVLNVVLAAGLPRSPVGRNAPPVPSAGRASRAPSSTSRAGEPTQGRRVHGPAQAHRGRLLAFVVDVANRPRDAGGRLVHRAIGRHRTRTAARKDDQPSRSELFVTTRWPSRCWPSRRVSPCAKPWHYERQLPHSRKEAGCGGYARLRISQRCRNRRIRSRCRSACTRSAAPASGSRVRTRPHRLEPDRDAIALRLLRFVCGSRCQGREGMPREGEAPHKGRARDGFSRAYFS